MTCRFKTQTKKITLEIGFIFWDRFITVERLSTEVGLLRYSLFGFFCFCSFLFKENERGKNYPKIT